jgi:hypothetical protein
VVVLEDDRKINVGSFYVKNAALRLQPFTLNIFYNEKNKLSLAELSANFENLAAASFGLKKLRQDSVLPYSLYALAVAQVDKGSTI